MSKYVVTLKLFGYLFPKKNYNKKTFSWSQKLLLFHPYLTVFCTLKVIHIFAQVFKYLTIMWTCSDLSTACFHAKTVGYKDHFSSSSLRAGHQYPFRNLQRLANFLDTMLLLKN